MNKEELIRKLQMVYVGDRNAFNELVGYYDGLKQGIEELQKENKKFKDKCEHLKRAKDIMENYLQLIIDIAYDYDGTNIIEGLKSTIDEIIKYALWGRDVYDHEIIYENHDGKKYNILGEEIGNGDSNE